MPWSLFAESILFASSRTQLVAATQCELGLPSTRAWTRFPVGGAQTRTWCRASGFTRPANPSIHYWNICSTNVQDLNHERLAAGQAAPSPPGPSQPFAAQFTPLPPSMRAGKRKGQRVVIHRIKLQSATVPSAPRFCDSFAITNLY